MLSLTDDSNTLTNMESSDSTEDMDAYKGILMVRNSWATDKAWAASPEFGQGLWWLVNGCRPRLVWSHDVSRLKQLGIRAKKLISNVELIVMG